MGTASLVPRQAWQPESGAFLVRAQRLVKERLLATNDGAGDDVLALGLDLGKLKHDVRHELLDNTAQAAGPRIALAGLDSDLAQRLRVELQLGAFHLEELLILADQGVAWLGEDAHQRILIERIERSDHRQTADKFRDH